VHKFCHEGGSAELKSLYEITPLDGILRRVGNKVDVTFSQGYEQPPQQRRRRRATTAASGVQAPAEPTTVQVDAAAAVTMDRAVRAAKQSDVAIVVAGLNHGWPFDTEGTDRKDMRLPYKQDELIRRVVEANPRTIVVLVSGGAVEMSEWVDRVPAIVQAWYPGLEGGNRAGIRPLRRRQSQRQTPVHVPQTTGRIPRPRAARLPRQGRRRTVRRGITRGYRWFDTKEIDPLFPFGHGLSYTKFGYSNLNLTEGGSSQSVVLMVNADIANIGNRAGAEVVQVYVEPQHPRLPRPAKELKAFAKLASSPARSKRCRSR